MATVLAETNKSFNKKTLRGKNSVFGKYIRRAHSAENKLNARKIIFYSAASAAVLAVVLVLGFLYFYNYYSAIVEQRVASGFWHTRAGIYAAPRVLKKDQRISKDEVIELLRRSGYVENDAPEKVWNGSFRVQDETVEILTSNYLGNDFDKVTVSFAGKKITEISDGAGAIDAYEIQPELLTGRSEAKRGVNHALRYEEIPENLRNAILAAEDNRFFEHYGLDPRGIARAMYENVVNYRIKQGGSTITQQLVKNTFLSPEKSFKRKFEEAFLSIALENQMSKEDIFALYCNEIYLGQYGSSGIHGVEQAARAYFGKELNEIDVAEAATIAAMIKNPNRFAPHKNEDEAKARREWIITKMNEIGAISGEQAEIAKNIEPELSGPTYDGQTIAPYFVDAATKVLANDFQRDVFNTNFNMRVYTTIDTQLQEIAEDAVAKKLADLDKSLSKNGSTLQASLVAINPQNGHVLAMVGGRDYRESQFNRATEARRQPGSTFKPFVYAAALERGMTPMQILSDRPTAFAYDNGKPYTPANYGGSYANDDITMKTALAKSSNVAAVETAMTTGLRKIAQKAEEFGFDNIQPYPSMALGAMEATPLQLAAAYAVFANGGRKVEPTFISKIVSGEDDEIYRTSASESQIISEKTAYMITDMLQAVVERGTARKAKDALGEKVVFAGKTGSSKDGWFVGYTPNLVTVVWVGIDESEDIKSTGGEAALPLWTEFMKRAVSIRPEFGGESFPMPKGLTEIVIDPETGMRAGSFCPHKEKVVVPVSASSNLECLRHQPDLPETLWAENNNPYTEELGVEKTIVITPATVTQVEIEEPPVIDSSQNDESLKRRIQIESRNSEKTKASSDAAAKEHRKKKDESSERIKTYLESYESQIDN